jgi:hypothetical protein
VSAADRRSCFVVALACAVGLEYRTWSLPLLAFALLEGASTLAARRSATPAAPVRLPIARDPGAAAGHPFDQPA